MLELGLTWPGRASAMCRNPDLRLGCIRKDCSDYVQQPIAVMAPNAISRLVNCFMGLPFANDGLLK